MAAYKCFGRDDGGGGKILSDGSRAIIASKLSRGAPCETNDSGHRARPIRRGCSETALTACLDTRYVYLNTFMFYV